MLFARSRPLHAESVLRLLSVLTVLVLLAGAAIPAHADNTSIPIFPAVNEFNFASIGHTIVATNQFLAPGVAVTLNPQPLPPRVGPDEVSLIDPTDPMISTNGLGTFAVDFAMFLPHGPGPGDPLVLQLSDPTAVETHWMAGQMLGDGSVRWLFDVNINLSAPDGNVTLGTITDGTLNTLPAVQLNFLVQGTTDPMADFQVFDLNTTNAYSFALAPEPATLMLLGSGVLALVGTFRKKLVRR